MEVIFKKGQINLPKNVKQIGTEQDNIKIYIEDCAYSFIKDIKVEEDDDGAVGILLGEALERDGIRYIFIKGLVEVLNAAVYTDMIAFTQETWPVTKKYINYYFGEYDIVGWYLTSSKITGDNMDIVSKAHNDSFDSENVFFMFNNETGDEAFWVKDEDNLKALTGYNVYIEKNAAMQKYISENQADFGARYQHKNEPKAEPVAIQSQNDTKFRKAVKEKEAKTTNVNKRNLTLIYALSMLVVIVVLIIGVNQINSYDKLNGNKESEKEANGTMDEYSSKTPITSLEGNATTAPTEENTTKEEPTTKKPDKEEPTTQKPTQEPTTAATEYETYVVKEGDGMWRICVTFYGAYTQDAANKILKFNGLSDGYSLQPGMTLKIPKE